MSEAIVVAIIGALGVVVAAIVGLFKKSSPGNIPKVTQKVIGKNNTQIGIQNNYEKEKGKHER